MVTFEQLCCRTSVETLNFSLTPTPLPLIGKEGRSSLLNKRTKLVLLLENMQAEGIQRQLRKLSGLLLIGE